MVDPTTWLPLDQSVHMPIYTSFDAIDMAMSPAIWQIYVEGASEP